MNKAIVVLLGAAALAVLGYFCIYQHSPNIQKDIHAYSIQALAYEDTNHISIATNGRDVSLTGTVTNQAIKQAAEMRVLEVEGVRVVNNHISVINTDNEGLIAHSLAKALPTGSSAPVLTIP